MRTKSPRSTFAHPLVSKRRYSFRPTCKRVRRPPPTALSVDIDAIAAELAQVNNANPLNTDFIFDIAEYPHLQLFFSFYDQLRDTLRKADNRAKRPHPTPTTVPSNERPPSSASSGDPTLEHVTDGLANHFLRAAFELSRVKFNFWWTTAHKKPQELTMYEVFFF